MVLNMKVINLFGSAGAGKSTTALGVAHNLKINGYKVEYVSEYAKQLVMSGCQNLLAYQEHVFTNQLFQMNILKDKSLDFIKSNIKTRPKGRVISESRQRYDMKCLF